MVLWIVFSGAPFIACYDNRGATVRHCVQSDGGASDAGAADTGSGDDAVRTNVPVTVGAAPESTKVFLILMENHNWVDIKGSPSAPYLNGLLSMAAHAEEYYNPPGLHPSEPNYIWLEAGQNFGVVDDNGVDINHQCSSRHLTALLRDANISWRSYQEDITGIECPLTEIAAYVPRHNPNVFFDDNTGGLDPTDAFCIAHNRPYAELERDLAVDAVPRYVFITPNMCNISHDSCAPQYDPIKQGDDWLANEVPKLLASSAYQNGAYVFITWDEGESNVDGPIGLIALSKNAKAGYSNAVPYTHSSMLRTLQEIFGVGPLLGDAAHAADLSDLFTSFP